MEKSRASTHSFVIFVLFFLRRISKVDFSTEWATKDPTGQEHESREVSKQIWKWHGALIQICLDVEPVTPFSHLEGLHPKSASTRTNDLTSACSLPPTGRISSFPGVLRYPGAGQLASQDNSMNSFYSKMRSACCQACLIIPSLRRMLLQDFPEKRRATGEEYFWNLNPQCEASKCCDSAAERGGWGEVSSPTKPLPKPLLAF